MATKIITKNSSTATSIPTAGDLVQGELAVNVTDKRLFTEDSGGAIVELGTNPSTIDVAGAATFSDNVTLLKTTADANLQVQTTFAGADARLNLYGHSTGTSQIRFGDEASVNVGLLTYNHADDSLTARVGGSDALTIDNSGNLGIGVVPNGTYSKLQVKAAATSYVADFIGNASGDSQLTFWNSNQTAVVSYIENQTAGAHMSIVAGSGRSLKLGAGGTAGQVLLDASGNLGIGTATITNPYSQSNFTDVNINGVWGGAISFKLGGVTKGWVGQRSSGNEDMVIGATTGQELLFYENNAEAMRISSGNLLVGKTSTDIAVAGCRLGNFGAILTRGDGSEPLRVNRTGSDGDIIRLDKDGTSVGSIGANGGVVYVSGAVAGGLKYSNYNATNASIFPCTTTGAIADAVHDLGYSGSRFRDIYRSGSTISTSDRNMKQDIRDLTDAERNVAVVAKGLLKAFRFINRVEEENDSAKIHFGIIAQDLAAAFEAEGLDANDYQVYRSDIFTDEDGKEQVRLGVCYENLLAFIIAAI